MISRKGLPDFMKKMSDKRLEELSDPKNFHQHQTPTKINVEFDRKRQKNNTKKKGKK